MSRAIAALALLWIMSFGIAPAAGAWPTVRQVDTKTYALSSDGVVAIDDASGDVSITGWASDRVEVVTTKTSWSEDDLHKLATRVDSRADHLSIVATFPRHCLNCDVSLQIHVPTRAHVTVETSSGDVKVQSLAGPARVDVSSGDVHMRDVAGEVHAHSSSGDISLDGMRAAVDAYASSGDIKVSRLSADANIVSSSGSITASFSHFDGVRHVRMESSSGDISLTVPRGVGFKLEATTSSGSITSNLGLPIRERDAGAAVSAQVGDGKASVELRATSGDIGLDML